MLWDLIRTKQEASNRMRDDWDSTIQRVWKKNGIRGWKRELVGEERSRHLVRAGGYERGGVYDEAAYSNTPLDLWRFMRNVSAHKVAHGFDTEEQLFD